jgi:Kelch motif
MDGTVPPPRAAATLLCLDESLYLFGGTQAGSALNDLHRFDLRSCTWRNLGRAMHVPQGAHLLPIDGGTQLAVVPGGGHLYDRTLGRWELEPLRTLTARRGSVAANCPSSGVAVLFGGEAGPGGAEYSTAYSNDLVLLDASTGNFVVQVEAPKKKKPEPDEEPDELLVNEQKYQKPWPGPRAWSAWDGQADEQGMGHFYMFGGIGVIDDQRDKRSNLSSESADQT